MASSLTTPRLVIYCDACGMPPEYCEYGPDFESHCIPWLKKNHPDEYGRLYGNAGGGSGEGDQDPEKKNAAGPAEPWTTRERLVAFYSKYMPEKLDGIDGILEKYAGKEDKLFLALVKKYGPEPEDPFYAARSDDDDDDEDDEDGDGQAAATKGMERLEVDGKKKRRGKSAKKVNKVDTRVIIQKISRNKKKAVTHVVGMETVPGVKLKEVSKAFSKRFAGSSSVKDKEIIIQGDHLEEVAQMIIDSFGVKQDCVFLDMDGQFVPFS